MKRILKYLSKEKAKVLILIILILTVTLLQVSTSYIQVWSFNRLVDSDFFGFLRLELFSLLMWFFLLFLNHYANIRKEKLVTSITIGIRDKYIKETSMLPYYEYKKKNANDYAAILSNDIEIIETNGFCAFFNLIETIFLMAFSLIALLSFHIYIAILSLILTIAVTYLPQLFTKKAQKITEKYMDEKNLYLSKNLDILEGVNILFSSNRMELLSRIILNNGNVFRSEKIIYTKQYGFINVFIALISISSQMILSTFTGYLVSRSFITLGVIGSVGNIAANVFNSLTAFSTNLISINSISNKLEELDMNYPRENRKSINFEFNQIVAENVSLSFGEREIINKLISILKRTRNMLLLEKVEVEKQLYFT